MAMNTRKIMIYAHLMIGSLFLPLMLLMPLTGSLYIWGYSGDVVKTEAFRVAGEVPKDEKEQDVFFKDIFKKQNVDFEYEYIRSGKGDYTFRPTTRIHYSAVQEGAEIVFTKVEPTLLRRLVELHKGHGPKLMRWFESAFGIALILVTLSGIWLAITVKTYRKATLLSFGLGLGLIFLCLF